MGTTHTAVHRPSHRHIIVLRQSAALCMPSPRHSLLEGQNRGFRWSLQSPSHARVDRLRVVFCCNSMAQRRLTHRAAATD